MSNSNETIDFEEKCRLLENQIKTLKDVSTIRKELLELREQGSKDFISKIENFETIIESEKELRLKLAEQFKETEIEYNALSTKFGENQKLLNETEEQYKSHILKLENQVKTLKDVSNIRKELLELREKGSKDFISRLKNFEAIIANEKELRLKLAEKLKETENGYKELNTKLVENQKLLNETEESYKSHITTLKSELEESKTLVQNKMLEINELEKQLCNADEKTINLQRQVSTKDENHAAEIQDYKMKISELESQLANAQAKINSVENSELRSEVSETSTSNPAELPVPSNEIAINN